MKPFDTSIAVDLIEKELGKPLGAFFSEISERPVAAASLAQVYKAKLLTGETVAVKVQRPDVLQVVSKDLYVLRRAAQVYQGLIDRFAPQQRTNYVALFNEWAVGFYTELDFLNEAANMRKMRDLLAQQGATGVYIPEVYPEVSTRRVLVTEWIDGVKLSQCPPDEIRDCIAVGQECFLVQLLQVRPPTSTAPQRRRPERPAPSPAPSQETCHGPPRPFRSMAAKETAGGAASSVSFSRPSLLDGDEVWRRGGGGGRGGGSAAGLLPQRPASRQHHPDDGREQGQAGAHRLRAGGVAGAGGHGQHRERHCAPVQQGLRGPRRRLHPPQHPPPRLRPLQGVFASAFPSACLQRASDPCLRPLWRKGRAPPTLVALAELCRMAGCAGGLCGRAVLSGCAAGLCWLGTSEPGPCPSRDRAEARGRRCRGTGASRDSGAYVRRIRHVWIPTSRICATDSNKLHNC